METSWKWLRNGGNSKIGFESPRILTIFWLWITKCNSVRKILTDFEHAIEWRRPTHAAMYLETAQYWRTSPPIWICATCHTCNKCWIFYTLIIFYCQTTWVNQVVPYGTNMWTSHQNGAAKSKHCIDFALILCSLTTPISQGLLILKIYIYKSAIIPVERKNSLSSEDS